MAPLVCTFVPDGLAVLFIKHIEPFKSTRVLSEQCTFLKVRQVLSEALLLSKLFDILLELFTRDIVKGIGEVAGEGHPVLGGGKVDGVTYVDAFDLEVEILGELSVLVHGAHSNEVGSNER